MSRNGCMATVNDRMKTEKCVSAAQDVIDAVKNELKGSQIDVDFTVQESLGHDTITMSIHFYQCMALHLVPEYAKEMLVQETLHKMIHALAPRTLRALHLRMGRLRRDLFEEKYQRRKLAFRLERAEDKLKFSEGQRESLNERLTQARTVLKGKASLSDWEIDELKRALFGQVKFRDGGLVFEIDEERYE